MQSAMEFIFEFMSVMFKLLFNSLKSIPIEMYIVKKSQQYVKNLKKNVLEKILRVNLANYRWYFSKNVLKIFTAFNGQELLATSYLLCCRRKLSLCKANDSLCYKFKLYLIHSAINISLIKSIKFFI